MSRQSWADIAEEEEEEQRRLEQSDEVNIKYLPDKVFYRGARLSQAVQPLVQFVKNVARQLEMTFDSATVIFGNQGRVTNLIFYYLTPDFIHVTTETGFKNYYTPYIKSTRGQFDSQMKANFD